MSFNLLISVCLIYVAFLFAVAFWAERRHMRGQGDWIRSPLIYTLSLSIYCTAWTFYGAVGYAARSGLEYLTVYLGPTLVMVGWWIVLRRLVRIGRAERLTSVADLISSRFGKSTLLGGIVTLLAVIGTTPYIALQLQSVTTSLSVFIVAGEPDVAASDLRATALWVAGGLAIFTILFGTRNLDVDERHSGVVIAIAVEAVVKLVALLAVGAFVVWGLADGVPDILNRIDAADKSGWQVENARWVGLTFLSGAAFLCLPRMFQVLVVENSDERQLVTASWAFPLYLLLISLFVLPIAVVGRDLMPPGSNPDLFVLTLPLAANQDALAMLAFLGGFSSATSMVIVAAIALSTMVSNHIVTPIWIRATGASATVSGDVRGVVLMSRRISIAAILALGYLYYLLSGGGAALAAIGFVSFAGVAQVLPALLGGIFWRGATRIGAACGVSVGFVIWGYCLFLPSLGDGAILSQFFLDNGPFGIEALRPQALFYFDGADPLIQAIFWSFLFNSIAFVVGSLLSFPTPLERFQGLQFISAFERQGLRSGWRPGGTEAEDLLMMSQRILGAKQAQELFRHQAAIQGVDGYLPDPTPELIEALERNLAGSVGAATAHAMMGQIVGGSAISVQDLMAVADEAAQNMEYSARLESKSREQEKTARQLRIANKKLQQLSVQKDAFLSQISHELRTPMTSIRSFSDILKDATLDPDQQTHYATIIHDETLRLTRLLDDLLDLSVLENGQVNLNIKKASLSNTIDRAFQSVDFGGRFDVKRRKNDENIQIKTDHERLAQVLINLLSNSVKYCDAPHPVLTLTTQASGKQVLIDVADNGSGVAKENQAMIFEKFARVSDEATAGSAGLGLAICSEILQNLGGSITYLPGQSGASFRVILPRS